MTFWTLIRRNLRFHVRAHLGVVIGAAIGTAALSGALVVGDSVRESLREGALRRLQNVHYSLMSGDRFFLKDLGQRLEKTSGPSPIHSQDADTQSNQATALFLGGTAARQDAGARANGVHVIGADQATWPKFAHWQPALSSDLLAHWRAGELVLINQALARQLNVKAGDELILRIRKPAALAQDAVIAPRNESSVALRLQVGSVLPAELLGDCDLSANQIPTANAFLCLDFLAQKLELSGRANLLIEGPAPLGRASKWLNTQTERLRQAWSLEDVQLSVHTIEPAKNTASTNLRSIVELSSSRVFLEDPIVDATLKLTPQPSSAPQQSAVDEHTHLPPPQSTTNTVAILTYLANLIQAGERATPYSMITAAGGNFVPSDMRDDEILINEWLAEDLQVQPGDKVALSYYVVDSGSRLVERTNSFRVRAMVAMKGLYADRTLMPDFPGVAKAESTHDWDTGFPLIYKIREKDEAYWKAFRGTPKAFITLRAGQAMWANRFGSLTAIRFDIPTNSSAEAFRGSIYRGILSNLTPAELGLHFEPVLERALLAANQSQDFGQLFIGFSLFLVVAALLLMALLFQLSLEQRAGEIGTLLAVGFTAKQLRHGLLMEGMILAVVGGLAGAMGGLAYAKAMLWGLTTVWRDAVGTFALGFHVTPTTVIIGICSSTFIALVTIWFTLRKQARRPARELLSGEPGSQEPGGRSRGLWFGLGSGLIALAIIGWALLRGDVANAGAFFGAGSLLLISGLALASAWLATLARNAHRATLTNTSLGVRGCARRRKRSLATIALLACGCFVIVSIGVFRLDANRDATSRSSGTGGFALIGEATLPVVQALNTESGREFFGLNPQDLAGVQIVPFRVHDGDDASCLNLNRAQKPRLLGVKPELLAGRFTFASALKDRGAKNGWELLRNGNGSAGPSNEAATLSPEQGISAIGDANSIEWALGKKMGDNLDFTDERGRTFKLRLIGAVANSILQGSLIIDEEEFIKRFPNESGYRFFLMDAPSNRLTQVSATLSRALQDVGLELTPAVQRLTAFNAVQNTYLGTFQILGGLGLLLGSAGLGVVVLRNIFERRGELALLLAVGFRRQALHTLVLTEHGALLGFGLALGLLAAFVAVLPALLSPAARLPYASLGLTLVGVVLNGAFWTWIATRFALRGNLLQALRNE